MARGSYVQTVQYSIVMFMASIDLESCEEGGVHASREILAALSSYLKTRTAQRRFARDPRYGRSLLESVTRAGAAEHRAPEQFSVRLFQFAIALSASAHEPCV